MFPHGFRNPPPQDPYGPRENQPSSMQDYHAPHYPPAYDSPSFHHPSSFHYPPAPGSPFNNTPPRYAPPPDQYLQHSSYPPPPPHQSLYPPPRDTYPPHYGLPRAPSFEAHQHSPSAHAHAHPTLGEQIFSSLEYVFARPAFGDHSHHSSENTNVRPAFDYTHTPYFPHHTSSVQDNKPQILERASATVPETLPSSDIEPPTDVVLPKGQLVRVFCKTNRGYNLAVKNGRLAMVEADTENESQQWIRDDRYSIRVRDSYGHPAFMLINKATKKVLKHASGKLQEVQLTYYSPDIQDDDLFWTESQDFGEGFKTLRMASNTLLNVTVGHGNRIEDGSPIVLDTWHKKDTQLWKIFPL